MYLDRGHSGRRTGWTYNYLGKDLVNAAAKLWEGFKNEEAAKRKEMSDLLLDPKVSASSGAVERCKEQVESAAASAEECAVFHHEFSQRPDAVYQLTASDVVYFEFPKSTSDTLVNQALASLSGCKHPAPKID